MRNKISIYKFFPLSPSFAHAVLMLVFLYQQLVRRSHTEIFEEKHYDFERISAKVLLSAYSGKCLQANPNF